MNIEVLSENAYARKVTVTVPATTVRAALEKAYQTVGRKARLPGFREGKVPRNVLEARFGASIADDVAGELIQESWTRAMADHGLDPVGRPTVTDQGRVASTVDFSFTIAVDVKPAIVASTYTGLSVYWPKSDLTEVEVEAELERRRRSQTRLTAVTDRPVAEGDVVQVELTVKNGDDVVLTEPGTLIRTRNESWFAGIESFLLGLSVDGAKTADVTFTEQARHESLKGKTLSVTAKVLGIQAMQAPDLTDELAKELGQDTVVALTADVRSTLDKGRADQARNQARANLLEALIAANPFEVPASMIEQNLNMLVEELKLQQAYAGVDPRTVRFTQAQMADLRTRAAFAAKGGLLLESVWKTEGLTATDADIEAKLVEIAAERNQTVDAIRGWIEKDGGTEDLRQRLLEEQTLDWLLGKAVVSHDAPVAGDAAPAPAAEVEAKPAKKAKPAAAPAKKAAPAPAEAAPAAEAAPEVEAKPEAAPPKKRATKKKADAADE